MALDYSTYGGSKKPTSIVKKVAIAIGSVMLLAGAFFGVARMAYNAGQGSTPTPEPTNDKAPETNENNNTPGTGANTSGNASTTTDSNIKDNTPNVGDNLVTSNNYIQIINDTLGEVYTEKWIVAGNSNEDKMVPVYINLEGDYSIAFNETQGTYHQFSMLASKDAESVADMATMLYQVEAGTYAGSEQQLKEDVTSYFMQVVSSKMIRDAKVENIAVNGQNCLVAAVGVRQVTGKSQYLMAVLMGDKCIEVEYVRDRGRLTEQDYQAIAQNAAGIIQKQAGVYTINGSTYELLADAKTVLKNMDATYSNEDVEMK